MSRDLLAELEARSLRRDELFEEQTGMLLVGSATSLYVMITPTEIRSGRRVIVTDGFFEMFTMQRMQIDLVRLLGAQGIPAIYVQTPGAGDGEGEPTHTLVADRVQAVLNATDELHDRAGSGSPCLVAPRVGAVVVFSAADHLPGSVSVCLWDPILDLSAYMRSVLRLERASTVLSGRPTAPPVTGDDGSWRDWRSASTFGVDATARQLQDFDEACSRMLGNAMKDVEALAVFVNERAANASRTVLEPLVGRLDLVTLGLRDPLQLGLRNAVAALDPTVEWIAQRAS